MLKLIGPTVTKILLLVFGVAVFALMIMLTFGSLGRIFPGDSVKQGSGLILFDIGALVWLIVFVGASRGKMQRGVAILMFVFCAVGAIAMAGADALMSGQDFVEVPQWVGQGIVYLFIVATALNLIALYLHHLNQPETTYKIREEAAQDKLVDMAFDLTEQKLNEEASKLAGVMATKRFSNTLLSLQLEQVVEGKYREIEPGKPSDPTQINLGPSTVDPTQPVVSVNTSSPRKSSRP